MRYTYVFKKLLDFKKNLELFLENNNCWQKSSFHFEKSKFYTLQ